MSAALHQLRRHGKLVATAAGLLALGIAHAAGVDDLGNNALALLTLTGVYFAPYEGKRS